MTRGRRDSVFVLALALVLPVFAGDYAAERHDRDPIFALFAASLHFLMGVGGMASFGHAAYFGPRRLRRGVGDDAARPGRWRRRGIRRPGAGGARRRCCSAGSACG